MNIPSDIQDIFVQAWQDAGLPLPGSFTYKDKPVKFSLARGEYLYRYFVDQRGVQHCYTPHPSTDGDYFVWDYVPKGKGARTGKAKTYIMRNIVRCARRKTAKSKAMNRAIPAAQEGTQK